MPDIFDELFPASFERVFFQARKLAGDLPGKQRVVFQVTSAQPSRLGDKPEEPFQPAALHPGGSLWDEAGGATGIGAYNDRAGLSRTTPSACVMCVGFAWPGWGLTTTVPYDQLTLLKQLITPGPRPLL